MEEGFFGTSDEPVAPSGYHRSIYRSDPDATVGYLPQEPKLDESLDVKGNIELGMGETKRLLDVLEGALDGKDWIAGEYSIADIAIGPWLRGLDFYGARDLVGWSERPNTVAYLERFLARPAVQRGLNIPKRD